MSQNIIGIRRHIITFPEEKEWPSFYRGFYVYYGKNESIKGTWMCNSKK